MSFVRFLASFFESPLLPIHLIGVVNFSYLIGIEREGLMNDTNDREVVPMNDTLRPVDAPDAVPTVEINGVHHDEVNGAWRTEAGRKGANRVHQLIEKGKLYEQEHGLKSGRQRLRQLIELGKLYETEHGVQPKLKERKRRRLSKAERDEVVATLLHCLTKMVKPSFRAELERLADALNVDNAQAA